ncbi:hypothetical protein A3Q56_04248 [Intoshia linei]|uniref:Uncharacterized protein n=1 Tax=Intoshia linei TaxID=1819745 RepID=A0A177B1M6_9BILA|nr:hypothetical protein A3Q56_04248 [Intoshia linei]
METAIKDNALNLINLQSAVNYQLLSVKNEKYTKLNKNISNNITDFIIKVKSYSNPRFVELFNDWKLNKGSLNCNNTYTHEEKLNVLHHY